MNLSQRTTLYIWIYRLPTDDLSYKKSATLSQPNIGLHYDANNAVDRDTSTCMRDSGIGRNSPYKTVLWKVDLGGEHSIYSITILFKNYDDYGIQFCILFKNNINTVI